MPKIVALFQRNPSLSPEEFRRHYEQSHVPLILAQGRPFITGYSRSYLDHSDPYRIIGGGLAAHGNAPAFDVMTQLEFRDRDAMEGFFRAGREAELAARKRADEARFLALDQSMILVSNDVETSPL